MTTRYGITYQKVSLASVSFEVFAEGADYASRATDRRSESGGAVICGGACVCWLGRTQKYVTLSR